MENCNCLSAQDSSVDMLTVEKTLVKQYATALTEMSSESLRQLIKENLNYVADDQNKLFLQMQKLGWYEVKPAEQQKIEEAKKQFCCE